MIEENIRHIEGQDRGDIMLYALSTCGWCAKTKALLEELGVDYHVLDVDLLPDDDKQEALDRVREWNPPCTFPTLVINGEKCITGFREDEIREALGA
jgi:glutaredoxin